MEEEDRGEGEVLGARAVVPRRPDGDVPQEELLLHGPNLVPGGVRMQLRHLLAHGGLSRHGRAAAQGLGGGESELLLAHEARNQGREEERSSAMMMVGLVLLGMLIGRAATFHAWA